MRPTQIAGIIGAVVLVGLALLGGEYSTLDWLTLRRQLAEEERTLQELRAEIDSLERRGRELESSAAAQERAAREEFGVIRDGEILYRVVPGR